MKKLVRTINKNKSYVTLILIALQSFLILITSQIIKSSELVSFMTDSAFIIFIAGFLAIFLIPFYYINMLMMSGLFKNLNDELDKIFIASIFIYILGLFAFIFTCFVGKEYPPIFFAVPGFMFSIETIEKINIHNKKLNQNQQVGQVN